jgi:hypothetical protein
MRCAYLNGFAAQCSGVRDVADAGEKPAPWVVPLDTQERLESAVLEAYRHALASGNGTH